MSKLKVSFSHFLRPLIACHRPKKQYIYSNLYLLSFIKTLRHYANFIEKPDEDKVMKYWGHQTIPEILSLADKLYEEERYVEVYEVLDRIRLVKEPEVLWRMARALFHLSFDQGITNDIRWDMIAEAQEVMNIAIAVGGKSAEVHKWTAIISDTYNGLINLKSRVRNFPLVRHHLAKACELNPNDFAVHYMLGKWFFQMCQLNWFQRMIAKYFIATEPPKSNYQQAYKYLARAEELQPRTFLPNTYLLGKTCVETGQYYKAKYYLNLVMNLPPKDNCEKCCISKAKQVMRKLERYDLGRNVLFYDPLGFND